MEPLLMSISLRRRLPCRHVLITCSIETVEQIKRIRGITSSGIVKNSNIVVFSRAGSVSVLFITAFLYLFFV